MGALAAVHEAGLGVPEDVSVVGYDDSRLIAFTDPPLTTVRTPRAHIGQAAAEMLLGLMRGEEPPEPQLDLGFDILQRQST